MQKKTDRKATILFWLSVVGLIISLTVPLFLMSDTSEPITITVIFTPFFLVFTYVIGLFMMLINYEGSRDSFGSEWYFLVFPMVFYLSIIGFFVARYLRRKNNSDKGVGTDDESENFS